jgi:hypothetical protein
LRAKLNSDGEKRRLVDKEFQPAQANEKMFSQLPFMRSDQAAQQIRRN